MCVQFSLSANDFSSLVVVHIWEQYLSQNGSIEANCLSFFFWRALFKITSGPQRLWKEIFLIEVSVSLLMSLFQTLQGSCSRLQLIAGYPEMIMYPLCSDPRGSELDELYCVVKEAPQRGLSRGSLAVPLHLQGCPRSLPTVAAGSCGLTQPNKLFPPAQPKAPRTAPDLGFLLNHLIMVQQQLHCAWNMLKQVAVNF